MREIKFKFWNKKLHKMSGTLGLGVVWEYLVDQWGIFNWEDVQKLQYTGLKDNTDKEIYEGDIREYLSSPITPISERQRRDIGVVVFENGRFFIRWKYRPQDLEWLGLCAGRAIGNVWENPELLKEAGA